VPVLGGTRETKNGVTLRGFTGAGADVRLRQGEWHTFNASVAALGSFFVSQDSGQGPTTWTTQLTLGFSEAVPGAVTFNLGASVTTNPLISGQFSAASLSSAERGTAVAFGSVQRAGLRPLPLIHVALGDAWSIDAHAATAYQPALKGWVETYTAGVSYER
jgi:hypothetical protein